MNLNKIKYFKVFFLVFILVSNNSNSQKIIYKSLPLVYQFSERDTQLKYRTSMLALENIHSDTPSTMVFFNIESKVFYLKYFPAKVQNHSISTEGIASLKWLEAWINSVFLSDAAIPIRTGDSIVYNHIKQLAATSSLNESFIKSLLRDIHIINFGKEYIHLFEGELDYQYTFLTETVADMFLESETENNEYRYFKRLNLVQTFIDKESIGAKEFDSLQKELDILKDLLPTLYIDHPYLFQVPIKFFADYVIKDLLDSSTLVADIIKGRKTIIYFWGTWCIYCKDFSAYTMPQISELIQNNASYQLITIASESTNFLAQWRNVISHFQFQSSNYIAISKFDKGWSGMAVHPLLSRNMITQYPAIFVIDENGNVIIRNDTRGDRTISYLNSVKN